MISYNREWFLGQNFNEVACSRLLVKVFTYLITMWHEFYNVKFFSAWAKVVKIVKNCIKWLLSCVNQAFIIHLFVGNSPSLGHRYPCLRPWVTILDLMPGSLKVSSLSCARVCLFPVIPLGQFWLLHLLHYGYNKSGNFPTSLSALIRPETSTQW